jgi:hypothetical protein|tara:strand:+ start:2682 stop:2828 length:147 start_codon:yes stop_codon:yes gene_type:complete
MTEQEERIMNSLLDNIESTVNIKEKTYAVVSYKNFCEAIAAKAKVYPF